MQPVVPTKSGIEVDSTEECSWTVTDAHKCVTGTLPERRLGCKAWSELGLVRATDWVVLVKLRSIAFSIVLTDRLAIKAHQKKGQTEVIRVWVVLYKCEVRVG